MKEILATIITAIISILVIIYIAFRSGKASQAKYLLKCPKCENIFEPNFSHPYGIYGFIDFVWKAPVFTKCPKCGKYSWKKQLKNSN